MFDQLFHKANNNVSEHQHDNRMILKSVMERNGFKNLKGKWWHYTLVNEPYPDEYFDFAVE